MSPLSAFLASLLAAWPATTGSEGAAEPIAAEAAEARAEPLESFLPAEAAQVRIEQHIIWRVTPIPGPARQSMQALVPAAPNAPRMIERKMGDCIPMSWIAGGQPEGGSRLLLFLRDRRLVAANLEKACSARDFYRGFYVDKPNADGKLCADRDRILSRSGARCQISSFRLLVADND